MSYKPEHREAAVADQNRQAKPIRDEIAVLRLQLISPETGFQQLTLGDSKPEPQPFLLRDTSLFDALNRISTEHGNYRLPALGLRLPC